MTFLSTKASREGEYSLEMSRTIGWTMMDGKGPKNLKQLHRLLYQTVLLNEVFQKISVGNELTSTKQTLYNFFYLSYY